MSTLSGGPNIVLNGLIAYFDAANPQSFNSNDLTIWRDLTKNEYHATNFNSCAFVNEYSGGIRLDGTNQYFAYNVPLTRALTTVIIGRSNQASWNASGVLASARTTNGFIQHPQQNQTNTRAYIATSYLEISPSFGPPNIQLPQMSTITTNGINLHTHYLNSSQVATSTTDTTNSRTDTPTTGPVWLGRDNSGIRYGNMTLYLHMLYNRELSSAEVYQNFNAFRYRFILP